MVSRLALPAKRRRCRALVEVCLRAIFISYRREDSQGEAGRLFDDLTSAFDEHDIFMDVDAIQPGRDFRKAIQESVLQCRVLLCLIGADWLTCAHASGGSRLNDPNDYVRLEIAEALRRDIPVIPVLLQGARMPKLEQLPPGLIDLAYRNAVEIVHARWKSDVQVLIRALRPYVAQAAAENTPTAPAQPSATSQIGTAQPLAPSDKVFYPPAPLPVSMSFMEAFEAAARRASEQPPPAPPTGFEPAAMARISKDLAVYIGPIAEIVVKRAAKRHTNLPDLCDAVAQEIEVTADRAAFLARSAR